jgi:glycosyltransferase involved in cell wall biosynthesis
MRIGFDGTPLLYTRAGVGTYVEQLLGSLVQLHPHWEYLLYSNKPLMPNDPAGTVPFAGYFPHSRWIWEQLRLPRIINQSGVHLCHFMNNSAPWACAVPYVITIHDASLFLLSQYHPRSRLLALRTLLPLVARRAQAVITVSHTSRQELIDTLHLPPEKVHAVYNGVGSHFRPCEDEGQRDRLRKQYKLPSHYVLYVGTIEPRKNIRRLIAAFAQVQPHHAEYHLVLVGANGWLLNRALEEEAAAADLSGRLHYLGFVPSDDLPGIYSLATLLAFPSLHEGFGLPLLEAMACGTPVLTSDRSAMPEVSNGAAYLVDPESVEAIAAGLHELLDSAAQREWLIGLGYDRVQRFSWTRAAQETAAVYEQIMTRS